MKIIAGNFGVKGSAFISRDNKLVIKGVRKVIYSPEQILSVTANVTKEKKFGFLSFIGAAIILSIILGMLFNTLGVVIALVIAIVGSCYTVKNNIVEVQFNDNKTVSLECTPRGVKKLVQIAPS